MVAGGDGFESVAILHKSSPNHEFKKNLRLKTLVQIPFSNSRC